MMDGNTMREIYETPESKAAEDLFCDDLASVWGLTMRRLAQQYPIDRLCFRDGEDAVGALEVKCLNKSSEKCAHYGDTYLNLEKYEALAAFDRLGLPSIYAIRLTDGDFACRIRSKHKLTVRLLGRTDRGDALDIKPVVRLMWNRFKQVNEDTIKGKHTS